MYRNKTYANKEWTPEELEQALKNDRIADREISNSGKCSQIQAIMYKIERMRSEQQNSFPELTQKKLAEKAGIGLSTYKDYLSGTSDSLTVKKLINIAHVLQCKPSDLMDNVH